MKTISKSTKAWLVYAAVALGTFALGVVLIELHCRYEASQLTEGGFEALSVFFMAWLELLCGLIPLLLLEFELFLMIRRRMLAKAAPLPAERAFGIVCLCLASLAFAGGFFLGLTVLSDFLYVSAGVRLIPSTLYEPAFYAAIGSVGITFLWMLIRIFFACYATVIALATHLCAKKTAAQAET